jgi:hypothetical protein
VRVRQEAAPAGATSALRRRRSRTSAAGATLAALVVTAVLAAPLRAQVPAPADSAIARRPRPHAALAVLEGFGLNLGINRFDAWVRNVHDRDGVAWARVTPASWASNIRHGWAWDTDAFPTNMFAHPYHGSMYFNAGRANGLDFWESAPLAFLGSLQWEYFGEVYQPSLNDLYNTGFGGIVLGEVYHRLGELVRDNGRHGVGRVLRELAALPLDPIGGLDRLLSGRFTRVGPNSPDRKPGFLGLVVQAGGRLAVDSGATKRGYSSSFVVDLDYGDAFRQPYAKPFDVFRVRLQVSPDGGGVNILRVWGRLWALELTPTFVRSRHILTVNQKTEYVSSPAYKFGGQSVEVGLVSGFAVARGVDLRTEVYAEGLMLGAVDARNTGTPGSERTYDFGPGGGLIAAATLHVGGTPVLSARWHGAYIHSVSGSPADHYTQFAAVESMLPVTHTVGIGAYAGWYQRRSTYRGQLGVATRFPEARVFLTWQPNRFPSLKETP